MGCAMFGEGRCAAGGYGSDGWDMVVDMGVVVVVVVDDEVCVLLAVL